jgi:transcriptional regulator with XRE-family HTH domain
MNKLIESISRYQELKGINNRQFAELIGVTPMSWSLIKRGKRQHPRSNFFQGIAQNIPELRMAVYEYMAHGNEGEGNG